MLVYDLKTIDDGENLLFTYDDHVLINVGGRTNPRRREIDTFIEDNRDTAAAVKLSKQISFISEDNLDIFFDYGASARTKNILYTANENLDAATTESKEADFFSNRDSGLANPASIYGLLEGFFEEGFYSSIGTLTIPSRSSVGRIQTNPLNQTKSKSSLSDEMVNALSGQTVSERQTSSAVSTGTTATSATASDSLEPSSGVGAGSTSRFAGRAINSGDTDATIVGY